jgi:N-acetylmuramoyl-L-alanine amidase
VCTVSRDIVIAGRVAFAGGEQVLVEAVVPNVERPSFRYVVLSQVLDQRFQLGDADIFKPWAIQPAGNGPEAAGRGTRWAMAGVALIAGLALVVGLTLFVAGRGAGRPGEATGRLVCIDPGHGGVDSGAIANGIDEKDVNLDISLRARSLLEARGFRVVMTRETDVEVSLARRCAIANGAGAVALVSIHNNAPPPDDEGTTTYRYRSSEQAGRLGALVQNEVVTRIRRPDRGVREKSLYVLRNVSMPAVLLEGVFLTSTTEARLILDPGFRQKMAEGVAAGVEDYLRSL